MLKDKILEKLLAIILIFTLTFSNFAFVTKSYASSITEAIFGTESDTGHENVEFEAYFETEENKETSVISDVNNEDLAISMDLNVQKAGYLKDAKIEIRESEEGKGLNFKFKEKEEQDAYVQQFEDNTVLLQQINNSEETVKISLPIEYKNEQFVNEENFSKDFLVVFTGIYVDDEGEENQISKETTLNVSWKDDREVRVETSATKYIDFGEGVILQTILKVDNSTEKNTLPVKESQIVIDVPNFQDVHPDNVFVVANSTLATNGQNVGEVVFDQNNWNYDKENNKLTINVNNDKKLVKVNEYEDEYLQDAEKELVEEERYYNGSGIDEYLITYTYTNLEIPEEVVTLKSNIEAKMILFNGNQDEENNNIITNNESYEYTLDGKIGEIVSLNIENKTPEVSKAYTYVNYGNSEKYETLLLSETMINISYTDIIEKIIVEDMDNTYVDKEGNVLNNNDIYYKQISISKENFNQILGETGEIKVLDLNNNLIATINNESQVNDDGNIVILIENQYSQLKFEMTKPVAVGNLVISNVKAMKNASVDKNVFTNISNISEKVAIKANYTYVENEVKVGESTISVNFVDTETKATLVIDRDNLSTLEENKNIELRIELNNAVDTSDVYGHSVFEIELPESIEKFEVTGSSLLYAEGLTISSIDIVDRKIIVTLDGTQEGINSGVLTNGANIVLNINMKVNLFTPAKTEKITLKYTNDNATKYVNDGVAELPINYSAPTGLVTINSISGYNNLGSSITSVRQGPKEDLIDIYSEAKTATMEIIIMNNNDNTVSNLSILGRIPFKGVKDIATGEELGTTIDTKLINAISSDERNSQQFAIYYSDNGEATGDLNDASNNWVENPENFDNIKSYLIVPVDSTYEMQEAEIFRFTYQFEIPENLPHNEKIYGTFLSYYTNNSEVAVTNEESKPDLVGLNTGAGPELSLDLLTNTKSAKEQEEIEINVIVTNIGNDAAEDINVEFPIPQHTTFISDKSENENVEITLNNNILKINLSRLEKDEKLEVTICLKINMITSSQNEQEVYIKPTASLTAKDLGTTINKEGEEIKVVEAEFEVVQYNTLDIETQPDVYEAGNEISFRIYVTNITDSVKNNVIVTEQLPAEFTFKSASIIGYDDDGITSKEIGIGIFDENTRTITWNIGNIDANRNAQLYLTVVANKLGDDITVAQARTVAMVKADGTDTYESNTITTVIGKPVLTVTQTTETTDTYVKEGEAINYIFTVKNEGKAIAKHVKLEEKIPDGIIIEKISYSINGIPATKRINSNQEVFVTANIRPEEELIVKVSAVAANLDGVQEKTVTNYATVIADNLEEITSNSITHIVEPSLKNSVSSELGSSSSASSGTSSSPVKTNIAKTYRISGTAWVDSNSDGMRTSDEQLLPGISVKLVNSDTGVIQKSVTTDSRGTYTFSGVENGNYLVVFDYDTVKYTVTTYKKDGVEGSVNSDAVTTKLEQDGKTRNGAITDVIKIENGSISGIDIGFVLADTFDLKLDKSISQIMIQTAKGTTTTKYDANTNFTKAEIAAKYLSGAVVYIEYTFTVSNIGDVAGYAKKLVDYIPDGVTFNSSLQSNANWYTGSDGNLYSTALAERELSPGESTSIKLVLTKQMTEENTGLINNLAEIYDDYNIYGISDTNSTPANRAQGENDLGLADISILIKTGEVFINISVIITSILLGSIVIFIAYNKIVLSKKKGGV